MTYYEFVGISQPVASLMHYCAAVVFLGMSVPILRRGRGNATRFAMLAIFSLFAVVLLTISGSYHLFSPKTAIKATFRELDHAAIITFIAATFTPTYGLLFRGVGRWLPIAAIWLVALVWVVVRVVLRLDPPSYASTTMYLTVSWIGSIGGVIMWRRYGWEFVKPLWIGGVAYSVGSMCEYFGGPTLIPFVFGGHEIWHIAVLIGMISHWKYIYSFASGELPPLIHRSQNTIAGSAKDGHTKLPPEHHHENA